MQNRRRPPGDPTRASAARDGRKGPVVSWSRRLEDAREARAKVLAARRGETPDETDANPPGGEPDARFVEVEVPDTGAEPPEGPGKMRAGARRALLPWLIAGGFTAGVAAGGVAVALVFFGGPGASPDPAADLPGPAAVNVTLPPEPPEPLRTVQDDAEADPAEAAAPEAEPLRPGGDTARDATGPSAGAEPHEDAASSVLVPDETVSAPTAPPVTAGPTAMGKEAEAPPEPPESLAARADADGGAAPADDDATQAGEVSVEEELRSVDAETAGDDPVPSAAKAAGEPTTADESPEAANVSGETEAPPEPPENLAADADGGAAPADDDATRAGEVPVEEELRAVDAETAAGDPVPSAAEATAEPPAADESPEAVTVSGQAEVSTPPPPESPAAEAAVDGAEQNSTPAAARGLLRVHAPPGVSTKALDDVLAALSAAGYGIEQAVRVDFRISETNVRYFHAEDADVAEGVAEALGARSRDFTTYRPQPAPGTIEVWLEG